VSGYTPSEGEPTTLTSGDTWTWYKTLADYPQSASWTIAYYLHGAFNLTISASTGPSDTQYTALVAATSTAALVTGQVPVTVAWDLVVINGTEKHALQTGVFLVRPNLATPPTAAKTHDELMLDAIRATLEGRATADVESYQIAGRALNRTPINDLKALEAYYATRVWRKRNGSTLGGPSLRVRF
jgi:hypothetical protein